MVLTGGSFRKGARVPTCVLGGGFWGRVRVGCGQPKEVREMRHRLSDENPNLQAAIDKGIVEKYGIYLAPCSNRDLQFEA